MVGDRIPVRIVPHPQGSPCVVVLVDDRVAVVVQQRELGEAVDGRASEKLVHTVDGAVRVEVPDQQPVVRADLGGLLGESVSVNVKKRGGGRGVESRQLDPVPVEVEHERRGKSLRVSEARKRTIDPVGELPK